MSFRLKKKPVFKPLEEIVLSVELDYGDTVLWAIDELKEQARRRSEDRFFCYQLIIPDDLDLSKLICRSETDYYEGYSSLVLSYGFQPTGKILEEHEARFEKKLAEWEKWKTENRDLIKAEMERRELAKEKRKQTQKEKSEALKNEKIKKLEAEIKQLKAS